ncbi:MAG TPA: DUF58 domain-containing protein [bacterium]|nr:DUF58 domain-containing protein [bacterium]
MSEVPRSRLARVWRRVRRALEPPRKLRPTRVGTFFLVGVLAVGVAAVNTGNNLLYFVLGMFLAAIVVSGILSERNLRGLKLGRSAVSTATAGEPATMAFVVSRERRGLPAVALSLHDYDPEEMRADGPDVRFARVDSFATRRKLYARVFPRRGVRVLTEVEVATVYPFGLFRKSRRLDLVSEVRVRPRVPAIDLPAEFGGNEQGQASQARRGEGLDLFGLRDHSGGDDARRIHWRASARSGKIVVKDPAREEPPQVVLELPLTGWRDAETFERAVERVAGLASAFSRSGYAVGLSAGALYIAPGAERTSLETIFDALVDVKPGDAAGPTHAPPPHAGVLVIGRDGSEATTITGVPGAEARS